MAALPRRALPRRALREPKEPKVEQLYCSVCDAPAQWSCLNCGREFCDRHLTAHRCDLQLARELARRKIELRHYHG